MVNKMCRISEKDKKCKCRCLPIHIDTIGIDITKSEHCVCYACKLCFHNFISFVTNDDLLFDNEPYNF